MALHHQKWPLYLFFKLACSAIQNIEKRVSIAPILHFYSKQRFYAYLDSLICICNECNEETQHHIDEQTDEGVEVDSTE